MSTTKHFVDPAIPIISGEYVNDTTGARQHLGVGMGWHPGGDLDTEQRQQEDVLIRLHYPADPLATAFEVQVSEVSGFNNPALTSAPGAAVFTVLDGVASFKVTGYTPQNTSVYPGAVAFDGTSGKQYFVRVRAAGGPWSVGAGFHPYYDSADDVYLASGLPNPIPG